MLRTNSKQARANIRAYIVENFTSDAYSPAYDDIDTANFPAVAGVIYHVFKDETRYDKRRLTERDLFAWWASGLPSIIDTCYYYNRSAVADLGDILDESQEERNRYTEAEAEAMLTYLIYREILKAQA